VIAGKGVSLNRLPVGGYDLKQALFQLPPLVKGYIRVGAKFGDGAYIDHQFNTVDVCVVMPVELISDRYAARFSVAA
jgi:putative hemolysin